MRAGVFDSGVGGLSVVKSLLDEGLFEEIIYYGDTARVPYGVKDKNTIISYSLEALEFFKNFEIDIFIAACNSVSAYAIEELQKNSSIPIVGVIASGVEASINKLENKESKILVIGTKATISSGKYERLLKQEGFCNITSRQTSLFVPIVEEEIFSGRLLNSALEYYFGALPKNFDAIILGCTHFPLIATPIGEYFNNQPLLIHSGEAIVEHLQRNYNLGQKRYQSTIKFFASSNPDGLKRVASKWL